MTDLDIGEVSAQAGVAVSTLRYYEEKGLIAPTGRRGLRRQFAPDVLDRLALISLGRTAGFTLDEIARTLGPDGLDRAMLAAKADELDRKVRHLTALRDSLRHAAACPAPDHLQCPTFQSLLHAARSGTLRPPR